MSYKFLLLTVFFVFLLVSKPAFASPANEKTNQSDQSLIAQLFFENMTESNPTFGPIGKLLDSMDNTFNNSETYQSIKYFWYNDIFGGILNDLVQKIIQFIINIRVLFFPVIITWLCSIVKQFFTNIDLNQIQNASANSNDFAFMLKQFNDTIFSIALDLSLLLFILSIWRYWSDAAWKGSGNLMSAVGRLIFAISTMLAWPNIYSFQIQLSNELMNALFLDKNGNIQFLDLAVARLFDTNNTSLENLANTSNIIAISIFGANSSFFIEYIIPIIFCFLAIILIYQLVYVIVLKAIQTALMTAQYVFAPIFLVLLANPTTDSIATNYIRTFVEVSLWNFIWIGLLKVLIILLYSNFNPWGKLLTCIGVLQIMMDAPQFLSHAKISIASDFVSPRFFVKSIKDIGAYNKKLESGIGLLQSFFGTADHRKAAEHKDSPTADLNPLTDNFIFANNNSSANLAPPPNKATQNEKNNSQSRTQPESPTGAGSNTIPPFSAAYSAMAASSTTNSSLSATNANGSGAVAISSANSWALAIASINSLPGPANDTIASQPPPPKPGPNGETNPGKKPGPGQDLSPQGSEPLSPGPTPPKPMSLLCQNSLPVTDTALSHYPPTKISQTLIPTSSLPAESSALKSQQNALSTRPSAKQNTQQQSKNVNLGLKYLANANCTTDSSSERDHNRNSTLSSTFKGLNAATDFIGKPALIFKQIYAFHTGAMNYHSQQSKRKNNSTGMYFVPFNKELHDQNKRFSLYSHDLIFAYGNIPTLMGIPPIYPETNKT